MTKEIRKERDFFGEKQVLYDNGSRVGEIRTEKTFFGSETNVYVGGSKVGEIREEGGKTNVHRRGGSGELNRGRDITGRQDLEQGRDFFGNKVTYVRGGGLAKLIEESKEKKKASHSSSLEGSVASGTSVSYQNEEHVAQQYPSTRRTEEKKKSSTLGKIVKAAIGIALVGGIAYIITNSEEK